LQLSIFHGVVNIAGIGGELSEYQRQQGHISDFFTLDDYTPRQNHDFNLKLGSVDGRFRRLMCRIGLLIFAASRYDVFHFYAGVSLLPFNLDLPILRLIGKRILMTYCGSDIRLVEVEKTRNQYWHLLRIGLDHPKYDNSKKIKMYWHNLWCHKFFISKNCKAWANGRIAKSKWISNNWIQHVSVASFQHDIHIPKVMSDVPLIVHAPSDPEIKGTKYIHAALERLKLRDIEFEYQELRGVDNKAALEIYKRCDIILDQFLVGGVGNFALEGMKLGKPVMTFVTPEVLEKEMPGCPIVQANIENLEERLAKLILDKKMRREYAERGPSYVADVLNYETINTDLIQTYRELCQ